MNRIIIKILMLGIITLWSCSQDYDYFMLKSDLSVFQVGDTITYKSVSDSQKFVLLRDIKEVSSEKDYESGFTDVHYNSANQYCIFENINNKDFLYEYYFHAFDEYESYIEFLDFGIRFKIVSASEDYVKNRDCFVSTINYTNKIVIDGNEYPVVMFNSNYKTDTTYSVNKVFFNLSYGIMKYELKNGEIYEIQL